MKTTKTLNLSRVCAAALLAAVVAAHGQGSISKLGAPRAVVRGGASRDADIDETVSPFNMVKYNPAPFDNARKLYLQFNTTGERPNTNGPLWITYRTAANSQRQEVQVWSLDQPYPGMSANLTWNTVQANDTNSGGGLLTQGPFTATPYQRFLSASAGSIVDVTHQLHGSWGHMIVNGKIVMVLTSVNNIADNGFRIADGSLRVSFDPITTGTPPSVSELPDVTVLQSQISATNTFTVNDQEDGASASVPSATSSNADVVDPANIFFGGSGANRTIHLTAGSTVGSATIVVSVTDSAGNLATRSFTVTVSQSNLTPVIIAAGLTNSIPPTNTLVNTAVSVPFAVRDAETANSKLTVSASVAPYSTAILQSATLVGTGANTDLRVLVTPVPGADGVGVVQLNVSDTDGNSNTQGFCVMVLPSRNTVFLDHFDYNNDKLTTDAPNFWTRRNAATQSVFFRSTVEPLGSATVAWIRPNAGAEDLAAPLAGGPYPPSSRAIFYTTFTAHFANATGANVITNGEGAFFRLSQGPTSASDFVENLALSTNDVSNTAAEFRLFLSNGTPTYTDWPANLPQPSGAGYTTRQIVMRYDVALARAAVWVEGKRETDPNVSATDAQNPVPVGYVGLFQERGNGDIYLDDLKVVVEIKPGITAISAPVGENVTIDFAAAQWDTVADFAVQTGESIGGPFSHLNASMTSLGSGNFRATVPVPPGRQGFYRIRRQPQIF